MHINQFLTESNLHTNLDLTYTFPQKSAQARGRGQPEAATFKRSLTERRKVGTHPDEQGTARGEIDQ